MKTVRTTILFFAIGTTILSCSKGGGSGGNGNGGGHINNPSDTVAPVLTINNPVQDQVFTSGSTINVSGSITDNLGLYRGSVRITNDANGAVLKEQLYEIHGLIIYNFNVSYTAVVTTAADYTVTVWYEDHGYNSATRSVKIKVNP
jgi:hypothetical protein